MNMKNTKAVFLIVLGSFILATGFAFAGAYDELKSNPFSDSRAATVSPFDNNNVMHDVSVKAPTPAPAPAPEPSLGKKIMKYLGDNQTNILMGGLGAYLGFALIGGPVGIIAGAFFLLFFTNI
jgi:hypothetical protein